MLKVHFLCGFGATQWYRFARRDVACRTVRGAKVLYGAVAAACPGARAVDDLDAEGAGLGDGGI